MSGRIEVLFQDKITKQFADYPIVSREKIMIWTSIGSTSDQYERDLFPVLSAFSLLVFPFPDDGICEKYIKLALTY